MSHWHSAERRIETGDIAFRSERFATEQDAREYVHELVSNWEGDPVDAFTPDGTDAFIRRRQFRLVAEACILSGCDDEMYPDLPTLVENRR
jgi:hypothetical protein